MNTICKLALTNEWESITMIVVPRTKVVNVKKILLK